MTSTVTTTASATMQNSFTTMATPGLDILAQATVAKDYGFDAIDLRVGEPGRGEVPPSLTLEEAEQLLASCEGVKISSLLCYNKQIRAGQAEMVSSLLDCISLARMMRCPMIRIFTGKISSTEDLDALISVLLVVLQNDNSSVKIGLQIHKNNGITVGQAAQICQQIPDARVGIILSPDQSILAGEDYENHLPALAKRVFQIYIADMDAQGVFTLIGDGIIDFASEIRLLRKNGFDGMVTLKWEKCWYPEMPNYTLAFPSFLAYYREHILPDSGR